MQRVLLVTLFLLVLSGCALFEAAFAGPEGMFAFIPGAAGFPCTDWNGETAECVGLAGPNDQRTCGGITFYFGSAASAAYLYQPACTAAQRLSAQVRVANVSAEVSCTWDALDTTPSGGIVIGQTIQYYTASGGVGFITVLDCDAQEDPASVCLHEWIHGLGFGTCARYDALVVDNTVLGIPLRPGDTRHFASSVDSVMVYEISPSTRYTTVDNNSLVVLQALGWEVLVWESGAVSLWETFLPGFVFGLLLLGVILLCC